MEDRSGLIAQADLTQADGHAQRRAAPDMIHRHSPGSTRRLPLGADKGHDSTDFVADLRQACVRAETIHRIVSLRPSPPYVAQTARHSAIDGRPTRHEGYAASQTGRKTIEEPFGRAKTVGGMAQTVCRRIKAHPRPLHPHHGRLQPGPAAPAAGPVIGQSTVSEPPRPTTTAAVKPNRSGNRLTRLTPSAC